jgi:two-component system, OmpR family, aerobic respiration control sensor histidine kinase ArcB
MKTILREEVEKIALEGIFKLLPVNFTWLDKEGKLLGCNETVLKCLEVSSVDEILGKTSKDLFLNGASENTDKVLQSGETLIFDEEHYKKDGTITYYLSIKSPILSEGNVIGVVNIAVDISKQKQLERKLDKEKALAELANKVKTEFLSSMRHDLRTPLSGLLVIIEYLKKKETDNDKKSYLQDAKECVNLTLNQLNNILDHVKIESGELDKIEENFSFHALLKNVYKSTVNQAHKKTLEFTITLDVNTPKRVIGDPLRTERILINVLSNAIKFTNKGYVRLTLEWIALDDGKGIAQFIIADSGIGIPEDKIDHIFERFTRLNDATTGLYPGTGLGLNIVKVFLSDINGRYDVISKLGKGSKFNICIPYKTTKYGN